MAILAASCNDKDPGLDLTSGTSTPEPSESPVGPSGESSVASSNMGPFGFGRSATSDDITAWDIDVSPDGNGLPDGDGTATTGHTIYGKKCAQCHGASGEGVVGGSGALILPYDPNQRWPQFPRTIGNYWPYATTLFDYINRAMPADAPGSLASDEIYSVVAWLLYENGIIHSTHVLNKDTLPLVKMPALKHFKPSTETPEHMVDDN